MICIKDADDNWHTAYNITMFYVSGSSIYFETNDSRTTTLIKKFDSPEVATVELDKLVRALGQVVYYKKEDKEVSDGIMVSVQ